MEFYHQIAARRQKGLAIIHRQKIIVLCKREKITSLNSGKYVVIDNCAEGKVLCETFFWRKWGFKSFLVMIKGVYYTVISNEIDIWDQI